MRFSDKVKIAYLTLVILFSIGVFFYLLDTWGIIRLQEYLPFISEEAPIVAIDDDSPTELELERLAKEQDRLEEEKLKLQETAATLEMEKQELQQKLQELEDQKKGLTEEKTRLEQVRQEQINRDKMIMDMAGRIGAMPPDDAVAIVAGWSNSDLVDVFIQMEKNAEEEGQQSIVPFLITKLPRDRAAIITSLMMDEKAGLLPR